MDNLSKNDDLDRAAMLDLHRYEQVNSCETLQALADTIRSFADDDGVITGRAKQLNAGLMADYCIQIREVYDITMINYNYFTRMWGIRQQAMYLVHYFNR